jgi:uncharacterized protein YdaU (DUF1376 family)
MSAPPYMKLYVADYLGDTHHLNVVEHGAYMLLLMGMWRAGGTLTAADANLARLARCTPDQWAEIKPTVLAYFKVSRGKLTHKRIAAEMAKYENTSGKRSEAGKAGVAKKARKINEQAQAIASETKSNCRHNQNQNQNQKEGSEDKSSASGSIIDDPARAAWDLAVQLLTHRGTMTDAKARAFFGKLLRDNALEARDLLGSTASAMSTGTADPQSYLTRAAQGVAKRRTQTGARVPDLGFV